jgi:hypothetical protein
MTGGISGSALLHRVSSVCQLAYTNVYCNISDSGKKDEETI